MTPTLIAASLFADIAPMPSVPQDGSPLLYLIGGALGGLALALLVVLGLFGGGFGQALTVAGRSRRDPEFAGKLADLLAAAPPGPKKPSGAPLRLLTLLQREGRLLDFLLEDIQSYPDAQIGVAVRDIHRSCQKAIKEHLELEPVLKGEEGQTVTVAAGFDPSAVRLTGNVTGQPPFTGTLQHHGWRVRKLTLAEPPAGQDEFVVSPAEVELP